MQDITVYTNNEDIINKLVQDGDLKGLTATQRTQYVSAFCQSLGLNPLSQPFKLIEFDGKLVMYATKDCTEQLRKIHGVSITDVTPTELKGVYVVTVKAQDRNGKVDAATGVVSLTKRETVWNNQTKKKEYTGKIIELVGDELANAIMKAETKAKRRVALSICGLGILDETELETIEGAKEVPFEAIDLEQITQSVQECGSMEDLKKVWETIPKAMQKDKEILNVFTTQRKKLNG
jgi:hypothetical protein